MDRERRGERGSAEISHASAVIAPSLLESDPISGRVEMPY